MPEKAPTHRPPQSTASRHVPLHVLKRIIHADKQRPSAARRGYGRTWQKIRRVILARDPVCQACGRRASEEVDHVLALASGGTNAFDNLQGLCKSCHSTKTATTDGGLRGKNAHANLARPAVV